MGEEPEVEEGKDDLIVIPPDGPPIETFGGPDVDPQIVQ